MESRTLTAMDGYLEIVHDSLNDRRTALKRDLKHVLDGVGDLAAQLEALRTTAQAVLKTLNDTQIDEYIEAVKLVRMETEKTNEARMQAVCHAEKVGSALKETDAAVQAFSSVWNDTRSKLNSLSISTSGVLAQSPTWCRHTEVVRSEIKARLLAGN